MTVGEIAAQLAAAGIEDPRREARILLAAAHNTDAAGLLALKSLDPALYTPLLTRRLAREPLAYILGRKEFWGLDFAVSPATLIPRPDSETLIEAALAYHPSTVLDLGTGTGCLLLSYLHARPDAWGIGTDLSPEAAALAARNAAALGLAHRASFLAANWADPIAQTFDLIFSNPPYIPTADIPHLMPEVARHEPASALAGGADGLAAYHAILATLPRILKPNGAAILEIGAGQAQTVHALAGAAGFSVAFQADLSSTPRAAILARAANKHLA